MDVKEVKVLLKLLGFPNYQASLSDPKVKPNSKTTVAETRRICSKLRDREWVDCQENITKIKLSMSGRELLKEDTEALPLSAKELKILRACQAGSIPPKETKVSPAKERDELIQKLIERGLLQAAETELKTVFLTARGKDYLLEAFNPKGTNLALSLDMLSNYISFVRKNFQYLSSTSSQQNGTAMTAASMKSEPPAVNQFHDEDILQTIIDLDRELKTDNYLPIYHLREKLQPPLTRQELDQSLYRLQRQNKIELSSLQEGMHYTPEQLDAALHQEFGGALFFVSVN